MREVRRNKMLWAIGAILLHFPAVPQAAVSAASNAAIAVEAEQAQQATPAAEEVVVADASASDDAAPFQPGRLVLTPVAGSAPAAAASLTPATRAIAPVIAAGRKPEFAGRVTDGQKRLWLGLAIAQHSAAAFDAWSTRRAITRGGAQELNPLLKPFANNGSIYAATQVAPVLLDLLGRRMMTSRNSVLRHTWWLPQVLGTAASIAGGAHNLGVR
jgi:hypothetical protein